MNGKSALFLILRLIVQICLFGMFLYFFGKPAVERYLEKKVVVVTSRRETGGTEAPAITVVVVNRNLTSWKKEVPSSEIHGIASYLCGEPGPNQSIIGCIEESTYDLSEISQSVNLGLPGGFSNDINYSWVEDFRFFFGRTYTLSLNKKLRYDSSPEGFLRIGLERNLDYYIFIHDLKYFYVTENPESETMSVRKIAYGKEKSSYYHFGLTEVEELDVPHDRCNNDPNYNFGTCVKESFSRKAGCKTKWDNFGNTDLELCTTAQQFR